MSVQSFVRSLSCYLLVVAIAQASGSYSAYAGSKSSEEIKGPAPAPAQEWVPAKPVVIDSSAGREAEKPVVGRSARRKPTVARNWGESEEEVKTESKESETKSSASAVDEHKGDFKRGEAGNLSRLPDSVLRSKVLALLDPGSQAALACASKSLSQSAKETYPLLQTYRLERCEAKVDHNFDERVDYFWFKYQFLPKFIAKGETKNTKLESLDLSELLISETELELIKEKFPKLRSIKANLQYRARKSSLEGLPFEDLGLYDLKDQDLAQLKGISVQSLRLTGHQLTNAGLAHLKDLKGLRSLNIRKTDINDEGMAHFKEMKIEELDISDTRVTNQGLSELKGSQIRSLDLTSLDEVNNQGLAHLKELPLQKLRIAGTQITDDGLAQLKGSQIRELALDGKLLTDQGIAHLKGVPIQKIEIGRRGLESRRRRDQSALQKVQSTVVKLLKELPTIKEIALDPHLLEVDELSELQKAFPQVKIKKGASRPWL